MLETPTVTALRDVQQHLERLQADMDKLALTPGQTTLLLSRVREELSVITERLLRLASGSTIGDIAVQDSRIQYLKSEKRFAKVFNLAPLPASIATVYEGRIIDVNEAFLTGTGYERDEVVGRNTIEVGIFKSQDTRKHMVEKLLASEDRMVKDVEIDYVTKAGEVRHVLGSFDLIELGDETCILGMYYDITDRKRGEEELHRAVQAVMQDTAWFSQALMEKLASIRAITPDQTEVAELRQRERQVLVRIAKGMSNEEIAAELGIANQTVRNYISSIYEKIMVRSRAEAVVWARERGLITD